LVFLDFACSNKCYANGADLIDHVLATPLYVVLPLELPDHNLGIDMVYLKKSR
jgi:hypothetical protein